MKSQEHAALVEMARPIAFKISVDWDRVRRSVRAAGRALEQAMREAMRSFSKFGRLMREAANGEERVSGLEGRYYVRGGLMCPDIDALVCALMRDPASVAPRDEEFMMNLLTPHSRARLAVKAIEGHVAHADPPAGNGLPWHRYMSGTVLRVG